MIELPEYLRQSLLARLETCPHSLYLDLKHDGGPTTYAQMRGSAFHAAAEHVTNKAMRLGESDLSGDVVRDVAQVIMDKPKYVLPLSERDAVRAMAWNFGEATELDLSTLVGTELAIEMEIDGYKVRGMLDRLHLYGHHAPFFYDYKTRLIVPRQDEYPHSFQANKYALLVAKGVWSAPSDYSQQNGLDPSMFGERVAPGVPGVWAYEQYPRHVTSDGKLAYREAYFDQAKIDDFHRTLRGLLSNLETYRREDDFPAHAGAHCAVCPAPHECPIPKEYRPVPGGPGEAKLTAEAHRVMDIEQKRIWKALREYADEHGPIDYGSDMELTFTLVESEVVRDKPGLKAAMAAGDVDPTEHFTKRTSTRFGKRRKDKPNA